MINQSRKSINGHGSMRQSYANTSVFMLNRQFALGTIYCSSLLTRNHCNYCHSEMIISNAHCSLPSINNLREFKANRESMRCAVGSRFQSTNFTIINNFYLRYYEFAPENFITIAQTATFCNTSVQIIINS